MCRGRWVAAQAICLSFGSSPNSRTFTTSPTSGRHPGFKCDYNSHTVYCIRSNIAPTKHLHFVYIFYLKEFINKTGWKRECWPIYDEPVSTPSHPSHQGKEGSWSGPRLLSWMQTGSTKFHWWVQPKTRECLACEGDDLETQVLYIKIQTWFRGFLVKLGVIFFVSSLLWELTDKGILKKKNCIFS